jgi:hypothetical protein
VNGGHENGGMMMHDCIECLDEGRNCTYGRQNFAFSSNEKEVHIFGGLRMRDPLEDIIIIDIGRDECPKLQSIDSQRKKARKDNLA